VCNSFCRRSLHYYGDEAGFEGYEDPFNRQCYRWGEEDGALIGFYRRLGAIRAACPALSSGGFKLLAAHNNLFVFERFIDDDGLICAVNTGKAEERVELPERYSKIIPGDGRPREVFLSIPPKSFAVLGAGNWTTNLSL
jgi:glycosidase